MPPGGAAAGAGAAAVPAHLSSGGRGGLGALLPLSCGHNAVYNDDERAALAEGVLAVAATWADEDYAFP